MRQTHERTYTHTMMSQVYFPLQCKEGKIKNEDALFCSNPKISFNCGGNLKSRNSMIHKNISTEEFSSFSWYRCCRLFTAIPNNCCFKVMYFLHDYV